MADTKITALTAITTVDPAVDVLPIVDVSDTTMAASGTTKKITSNQILGAGGTATLASATITGDLTVRTNKLLVTSTGVGVGMTPITPLSGVIGTTGAVFFRTTDPAAPVASPYIQAPVSTGFSSIAPVYGFWYQGSGIGSPALNNVSIITDSTERYKIDATGVATWSNVGGVAGTAMTLNSTGLGVGASPVEKLTVAGDAEITGGVVGQGCYLFRDGSSGGGNYSAKTGNVSLSAPASGTLRFNVNNGTFAGQFDTSGNLILSATSTPPTLTINGQLVVNATSNTNLRFSYRGSDGVTRVANLTLA